jgi:ankyrin repeat protein
MHTRTTGILKKNQIYGHHELRHLCEVAQDDRGWEKVRNWFLSHSAIESKKSVSRTGEDGTVAIHMACKSSAPLDIIEMLLNACEDSLEFKDDYGWCPLHYACHYGASEEVIRVLILSCPKVLKEEDSKGRNPLHFAVGNKCKDMPFSASVFTMLTQSGAAKQVDAKGMLVSFSNSISFYTRGIEADQRVQQIIFNFDIP